MQNSEFQWWSKGDTWNSAKMLDEPRFFVVGIIDGKHWSGVITYRNESIRIISVRRARQEEVDIYES